MFSRLLEASSFAGYGLVAQGLSQIAVKDYQYGIPTLLAGLAAVFKKEGIK